MKKYAQLYMDMDICKGLKRSEKGIKDEES